MLMGRYKNDPQITAMTDLVSAYQTRDVVLAERILKGESARSHPERISVLCAKCQS